MKILVSGFEPFGDSNLNPSQELVNALPDSMEDIQIIKIILPVDQALAPSALLNSVHHHLPEAVLSFGLAEGRAKISLERVALNLCNFNIPDNKGVIITDQAVIEGGPAAYFSTLPVNAILAELLAKGIPADTSLTAGTFLCNQVFYALLHEIISTQLAIRAGIIHLPALPEQAAKSNKPIPSLSLDIEIQAAKTIISQLQKTRGQQFFDLFRKTAND